MQAQMFSRALSYFVSGSLLWNLCLLGPVRAQSTTEAPALIITVLEADPINNIKTRTAREVIVRVDDENHKPVAGALVVFFVANQGPGGTFLNGMTSVQVMTDETGKAVALGFRPNEVAGHFQIQVSASYDGHQGRASIPQENVLAPPGTPWTFLGLHKTAWILIGSAVGAGAAGAAVGLVSRGSNTTTITPGTSTVSAPH